MKRYIQEQTTAGLSASIRQYDSETGHQAAVDLDVAAAAEAGSIAGEKGDDFSHFLRLSDSTEGLRFAPFPDDLFLAPRGRLRGREPGHRRIDAAGADRIRANAGNAEVDGDRPGQGEHAAFRGGGGGASGPLLGGAGAAPRA